MEHYITCIHIDQVRHLNNIDIELNSEKRANLILTGKNGSGKTSLLNAIKRNLLTISSKEWHNVKTKYPSFISYNQKRLSESNLTADEAEGIRKEVQRWEGMINTYTAGITLCFNQDGDLETQYQNGAFITAFFPANRLTKIHVPHGVENIKLDAAYTVDSEPVKDLVKYLVHLKTQEAYAKNERDTETERLIKEWFSQFQKAIQKLMDDSSITLKYDYKRYNFTLQQEGRLPFGFDQLSDGYSAAIYIAADLLMRMDQNWLLNNSTLNKKIEGIVLIDEIETHLHLELQRSILPFLTEMFPNIQFIVSTHSPFVVSSLENAVIFDLENKTLVKNGLSNVTYEGVVEGYFHADALSETLRTKFEQYKRLVKKDELTDDEMDDIMSLEQYLDEIPDYLSIGIAEEYKRLKLEFLEQEDRR